MNVDVLVVGAGLAGLRTATLLARRGHDVLLAERRSRLDIAIRTTGIFVRRSLEDFALPEDCLGPPIRRVVLYPPSRRGPVTLLSAHDEYRVADMAGIYADAARTATAAGVRVRLGTRYDGRGLESYLLTGPDGPVRVRARYVVGADGARSRVARDLGLDRNRHLLAGAEEIFPIAGSDQPPAFHCVIDPRLAPGYLAWVIDDGKHAHVGVAGYPDRFPDGMRRALARFAVTAPGLDGVQRGDVVERRGGPIPVGGVLRRISCVDGLLVGDAAGAVSSSPPAASTRACGCPSRPPPSSTTRCAPAGPTRWPTTTAPTCGPGSAAGCCCGTGWPGSARRRSRPPGSRCCAPRPAGPPPAASCSGDAGKCVARGNRAALASRA